MSIEDLLERARRFRVVDIVAKSGLSRRTVTYMFAGHDNVTQKTLHQFKSGVEELEKEKRTSGVAYKSVAAELAAKRNKPPARAHGRK